MVVGTAVVDPDVLAAVALGIPDDEHERAVAVGIPVAGDLAGGAGEDRLAFEVAVVIVHVGQLIALRAQHRPRDQHVEL